MSEATIDQLKQQVEELSNIQRVNEFNFQKQLEAINAEYREKEELMVKIVLENGGGGENFNLEQLNLNGEDSQGVWKQTNEIFRQYLKNKENEIMDGTSNNNIGMNNANNNIGGNANGGNGPNGNGNKKVGGNKAVELKKQKEQQYNQSKTALSRRVAELERKTKEDEKKFESMRHKFEQTNQEKEQYKRQLDNHRQKIKNQEIQEIKQSKMILMNQGSSNNQSEDVGNGQSNNNAKSPKQIGNIMSGKDDKLNY